MWRSYHPVEIQLTKDPEEFRMLNYSDCKNDFICATHIKICCEYFSYNRCKRLKELYKGVLQFINNYDISMQSSHTAEWLLFKSY